MIEKQSENSFLVKGMIDFDNVSTLLTQACQYISQITKSECEITFDFSKLDQSNSAGLALLTSLLRFSEEQHKTIHFMHLPAKLWAAAKISDLDKILP